MRWTPARAFGPERARGMPGERAGQVARELGPRGGGPRGQAGSG